MLGAMPKVTGSQQTDALRRARQVDEVDLSKASLPSVDAPAADEVDLNTSLFGTAERSANAALGKDASAPRPVGSDVAAGAGNVFNLQLARSEKAEVYTGPPISRSQALDDVLAEALALGVEIRSGQEADDYLNFAARMTGMPPDAMQAATLGADLVFVRDVVKDDPRVLREELIHTQQQAAGVSEIGRAHV